MIDLDYEVGRKSYDEVKTVEYDVVRPVEYFMSVTSNHVEANDRLTQIGFKKTFNYNSITYGSKESNPIRNPSTGLLMQITL